MRFIITFLCAVLLTGCQGPSRSANQADGISSWLEKQVTALEARQILLSDLDRMIERSSNSADQDSAIELEILKKRRKQLLSALEVLLSRSRSSDQIWAYRTYVTSDGLGGESGIALVRHGRVIRQIEHVTHD